jgi:triacylglycerol esterase/lipase EstA (alpha/beta hydrolase family)
LVSNSSTIRAGGRRYAVRRLPLPLLLALTVVTTAVVVLGLVFLVGSTTERARPFAGVAQDRPGPIVLVPGYGGNTGSLELLAVKLRVTGRPVAVFRLPGNGTGDLRDQARALDGFVREVRGTAPSVDVVGYSAGGVVTRLWVADFGGRAIARRVVTLGSPHHGTRVAGLARAFASSSCPSACQQLAPDSSVLSGLNSGDETPSGPLWTSVWTDLDQIVTPPDSGRLEGSTGIRVQAVCADERVDHSGLPGSPLVTGIVFEAVGGDAPAAPGAGDCARLRALGAR